MELQFDESSYRDSTAGQKSFILSQHEDSTMTTRRRPGRSRSGSLTILLQSDDIGNRALIS